MPNHACVFFIIGVVICSQYTFPFEVSFCNFQNLSSFYLSNCECCVTGFITWKPYVAVYFNNKLTHTIVKNMQTNTLVHPKQIKMNMLNLTRTLTISDVISKLKYWLLRDWLGNLILRSLTSAAKTLIK